MFSLQVARSDQIHYDRVVSELEEALSTVKVVESDVKAAGMYLHLSLMFLQYQFFW